MVGLQLVLTNTIGGRCRVKAGDDSSVVSTT